MKKLIFIIPIVGVLVFVGYIFLTTSNKGTAQKELSERSKEFLKKQQSQGNLDFGGINSAGEKTNSFSSEVFEVEDCFSISIPFGIQDTKDMGECFAQIQVVGPKAMVNVYTREVGYPTLDEDSGVKLRRTETKTYKEDKKEINGKTFLIFKKTEAGYEKTALYLSGGKLFGLNLLANIDDKSLDAKFIEMLESVEFL